MSLLEELNSSFVLQNNEINSGLLLIVACLFSL